ncbi:MAG: serine/threonine-protein kinase, partial [Acidobacteria bacterium]|nr:serine/threonine-protein kinase [Acidobacteriota bacterium]
MTPDRWLRIDKLLDEAMELPSAERPAFLHAACIDDEALLREVESLLEAHEQAEAKFLKAPALEIAAQKLAADKDRSLIGRVLGAYSVISVLGVGGMGEVYLARDTRLNRNVALKFLPSQFTQDAARVKRFKREAQAASALNHPNIITIYEIGEIENKHFIAAEYIDGQTLREVIAEGRVAEKEAIEIAIQICSALSAAHEAGIIHRDIKPENIMRRRDGYVKVLDFGLVKLTELELSAGRTNPSDPDIGKTNPGAVLGTARYMSPEQAIGQEVDRRSDVFSLGVTLYELLAGLPPFKGDRIAAILDAIIHHQPVPLTAVRPDLHSELERIVSRALEKDRELRYQSADDLRAELKRLQRELDSSEVVATKHQSSGVSFLPSRKSRWGFLSIAAGVFVICAALLGWKFLSGPSGFPATTWNDAKFTALTDMPGREANGCISPDGQWIVYSRLLNGQWDIFRQRIGGSKPVNLTDHPAADGDAAISPDGQHIAFYSVRDGGGIFIMEATGENVRKLVSGGRDPDWSPDGKEIIYSTIYGGNIFTRSYSGGQLWAVNIQSSAKRRIEAGPDAVQPRWSPHAQRIAFWGLHDGEKRDVWTIPAAGGQPIAVTQDAYQNGTPVWSPDGRYLYYCSNRNGRLSIWRVAIDEVSGQVLSEPELVPTQAGYSHELSIAADGKRLLYTARRELANLFRVAFDAQRGVVSGKPIQITFGGRRALNSSVSPAGDAIAYFINGDPQFDIFVTKVDGSVTNQVTNDAFKDWTPRWSPDGKRLAFFSNMTGKYEIYTINPDGSDRQQLTYSPPHAPGFVLPVWSPDGKRMAFSHRQGDNFPCNSFIMELTLPWQAQTLFAFPPTPEANGRRTNFTAYGWSPDGTRIVGTLAAESERLPGLVVFDLASGTYERITNEGDSALWLQDNRRLIYYFNLKIYLVDTQTKKPAVLHSLPNMTTEDPALSRDN